jgi:hypothetical protein
MAEPDVSRKAFERAVAPRGAQRLSARHVLIALALWFGLAGAMYCCISLIQLPFSSDAKTQLQFAMPGQTVVLHETHTGCGVYSTLRSPDRRLYLLREREVITAPFQKPLRRYSIYGGGVIERWSACMSRGRGRELPFLRRAQLAIWIVNTFQP